MDLMPVSVEQRPYETCRQFANFEFMVDIYVVVPGFRSTRQFVASRTLKFSLYQCSFNSKRRYQDSVLSVACRGMLDQGMFCEIFNFARLTSKAGSTA